jgi:hypothetical protein
MPFCPRCGQNYLGDGRLYYPGGSKLCPSCTQNVEEEATIHRTIDTRRNQWEWLLEDPPEPAPGTPPDAQALEAAKPPEGRRSQWQHLLDDTPPDPLVIVYDIGECISTDPFGTSITYPFYGTSITDLIFVR